MRADRLRGSVSWVGRSTAAVVLDRGCHHRGSATRGDHGTNTCWLRRKFRSRMLTNHSGQCTSAMLASLNFLYRSAASGAWAGVVPLLQQHRLHSHPAHSHSVLVIANAIVHGHSAFRANASRGKLPCGSNESNSDGDTLTAIMVADQTVALALPTSNSASVGTVGARL